MAPKSAQCESKLGLKRDPSQHQDHQSTNDIQFKQFKPKPNHSLALNTTNNSAPYPCRYCQYHGKEEYHWHSECPVKAKYRNQPIGNSSSNSNGNNRNRTSVKTLATSQRQPSRDSSADSSPGIPTAGNSFAQPTGKALPLVDNSGTDPYPSLDVTLNGKPIKAIIDSGSSISFATEQTFRSLNTQLIPNSSIQITQLCGQFQTIGCFKAKLQISNKFAEIKIHVIPNTKHSLLLGLDVGKQFGLQIDLKSCKVSTKSSPSATEYSQPQLQTTQTQTPQPQPPQQQSPQIQSQQPQTPPKQPKGKKQNKLPPITSPQSLQITYIDHGSRHSKSNLDPGISMPVSRSDAQHKHNNTYGKFEPNSNYRTFSLTNKWLTNTAPDPQSNHHQPSHNHFLQSNHLKPAFVHPEQNLQVGGNVVNHGYGLAKP